MSFLRLRWIGHVDAYEVIAALAARVGAACSVLQHVTVVRGENVAVRIPTPGLIKCINAFASLHLPHKHTSRPRGMTQNKVVAGRSRALLTARKAFRI